MTDGLCSVGYCSRPVPSSSAPPTWATSVGPTVLTGTDTGMMRGTIPLSSRALLAAKAGSENSTPHLEVVANTLFRFSSEPLASCIEASSTAFWARVSKLASWDTLRLRFVLWITPLRIICPQSPRPPALMTSSLPMAGGSRSRPLGASLSPSASICDSLSSNGNPRASVWGCPRVTGGGCG